ncbi:MAG: hypothetical protein JWP06_867 [Candidatus Saccharibacteria bacterium]|nr:hypothetical protein [Candidatus Saccharibacteria bacterium]
MIKKRFLITFRIALGGLALAGVATQLYLTITNQHSVINFFSYFTILSNIIAAAVFIISAVRLGSGYAPNKFDDAIRGASIVYMIFVGIVFSILLRDTDLGDLMPWINTVHHYIMPVAVIIDWVLQPPKSKISKRTALLWLSFPAIYVAYSLIRGVITGFYPYPFFSPSIQNGYSGVAVYCIVMLVAFVVLSFGVRWMANNNRIHRSV